MQADYKLSTLSDKLESCKEILRLNSPSAKIANLTLRVDELESRLDSGIMSTFHRAKDMLAKSSERLASISPQHRIAIMRERVLAQAKRFEILNVENTLKRGFALTTDLNGKTITATSIKKGDIFNLRFADGKVSAKAEEVKT
jgi:exonuclease VII large subunit